MLSEATSIKNAGYHENISKIASSCYFVFTKTMITELSQALEKKKKVHSIGVVDDSGKLAGIVIRKDLFDALGKPYGQDILKHKAVEKIMREPKVFAYDTNILAVAEEIKKDLEHYDTEYYCLMGPGHTFSGIFTSMDMMIYLSKITQNDINLARTLQGSMVKGSRTIEGGAFRMLGEVRMAKGVGGDYYSMAQYDQKKWLITLCDVSGKGMAASLVTTCLSGMFSMFDFKNGVCDFITRANQVLYGNFDTQKFVTGIFADYNEETGWINLYDMGHSYNYLFRDSKFYKLKNSKLNLPLGVASEIHPDANPFSLRKDDLLIFISDGVVEQTNASGEEFSEQRLSKIIQLNRKEGLEKIRDQIFLEIDQFRASTPIHDDMTLLMMEMKG